MAHRVQRQCAVADQGVAAAGVAADQGAHASAQFIEVKGLDQIIVGAGVEAFYTIGDGITRRDNQHGQRVAFCSQAFEDIEAVAFRQAEVQQHEIVRFTTYRRQGRFAVLHPVHRESIAAQRLADALRDHSVVFY